MLIADYYLIRRMRLDLPGLYRREGPYWYRGGWNPCAIVALAARDRAVPARFRRRGRACRTWRDFWSRLYDYAWFVSFGVSFVGYLVLMKLLIRLHDSGADAATAPAADFGGQRAVIAP